MSSHCERRDPEANEVPEAEKNGEVKEIKCYCDFKMETEVSFGDPHKNGFSGKWQKENPDWIEEGMVREEVETMWVASILKKFCWEGGRENRAVGERV